MIGTYKENIRKYKIAKKNPRMGTTENVTEGREGHEEKLSFEGRKTII